MTRFLVLRFAIMVVLLGAPSALAQLSNNKVKKDSAVKMSDEDPAMRKAIERARAGLDDFLRMAVSPPPDTDTHMVKVRVIEGESQEGLWVSNLKAQGDLWSGRIESYPMILSLKKGQSYSFTKTAIVDWAYIDKSKKKAVGHFTTRVLFIKESPSYRATLQKEFGLECGQ